MPLVEISQSCKLYMQLFYSYDTTMQSRVAFNRAIIFWDDFFATTTRTWPDVFAVEKATMDLANSMLNMAEDMQRVILGCQASVSFHLVCSSLQVFLIPAPARKQLASREGRREADSQSISEQIDSNLKPSKPPVLGHLGPKASIHRGRGCLE